MSGQGKLLSSALGVIILPFVSQGSKCQMWNSESFKLKMVIHLITKLKKFRVFGFQQGQVQMLDNVIINFFLSVSWFCFPLCQTHHLAVSLQGMPEMSRPGQTFIPQLSHLRGKAPENVPGLSFMGQSGVRCPSFHQSPQPASHWLSQVTSVLQNKGIPVGRD